MQADKSRKDKGTPVCDHRSRLEIIEDSLPLSHKEVDRRTSSRRHVASNNISDLTLPCHQEVHVSNAMSGVVICHFMTVDHVISYSKIYFKV